MQTHDDEIEFDFFDDEPRTGEAQQAQRGRLPRVGGRRPHGPVAPRGPGPLLRLLALVLGVIALVLVFALVIQSCASSSKHSAYSHYMSSVDQIAQQSTANGRQLAQVLTTPGLTVKQIVTKLNGIADSERQNVQAAQDLGAPGRLRPENEALVQSLQFRVSGLAGLADTFARTTKAKVADAAALLSGQGDRLLTSDIVWDDLFKAPATDQLRRDGVTGVTVPESHYVLDTDLTTEHSMALVLERIRGASTGGTPTGLHGTNIVAVKALPNGPAGQSQILSPSTLNTVTATTSLAFQVVVHNGGDSQEVHIPVTLTIEKSGNPIVKTQTIDLVNPGTDVTVTFSSLGQVPFATQTTLKVDVKPVPGEQNTSNNSAQFPVIFSLP